MRSLLVAVLCVATSGLAQASEIEWEVGNRFRAFDWMPDSEQVFQRLVRPEGDAAPGLADMEIVDWYRRTQSGNAPLASPFESAPQAHLPWQRAERVSGRTGKYRDGYLELRDKRHIYARLRDAQGERCDWKVDGIVFATGVACDARTRLLVSPAGFSLSAERAGTGQALAQTADMQRIGTRLIVGLGDSYASGEGNPDRPAAWLPGTPVARSRNWFQLDKPGSLRGQAPQWLDTQCHRSFWAYQNLVALKLAAGAPHDVVVFAHFACSGAEMFDGLLSPQWQPPGTDERFADLNCNGYPQESFTPDSRPTGCRVARSQLRALADLVCPRASQTPLRRDELRRKMSDAGMREHGGAIWKLTNFDRTNVDLVECAPGSAVRPELILLSIGGNDIGFAGLGAWAIVPPNSRSIFSNPFYRWARHLAVTCPNADRALCGTTGNEFITQLPSKYAVLAQVLDLALGRSAGAAPTPVWANSYPSPLPRAASTGQAYCANAPGVHPDNHWGGAFPLLRANIAGGSNPWEFNVLEREARTLQNLIVRFRQAIRTGVEAQSSRGFRFVASTSDSMDEHGFCETSPGLPGDATPIGFPSLTSRPWAPAEWQPYAPRARYIRTLNDAVLTQCAGSKCSAAGTLHPTAEAHAETANRVFEALHR